MANTALFRHADTAPRRPAHIAVCVPTFQRNDMLRDCLNALRGLRVPEGSQVDVVVADNDAAGGARALCAQIDSAIRYVVEPRRGLASVRNRLLEEALELGADWIAFVDDDERPGPHWLELHLRTLAEFRADVSSGPVAPVLPGATLPDAPQARRPTGSSPRNVACNNVVFRAALARDQRLRFDPAFDFIGGEDFEFFERSRRLGNRHVYVAEAVVFETVPPERATLRYLFRRHFGGATNAVVRHRKSHGAASTWAHFLLKSTGKICAAAASLLCALPGGRRHFLESAVKQFASALGYLSGLFNLTLERYR